MSVKRNGSVADENRKEEKEGIEDARNTSENFDPPDGGWGWIIVLAAGFSNFCILPTLQSFGLIFRDRFAELGINSSQITTILNIHFAVTYCIGLANGPLFRKFSFRQVAFTGALLCAVSVTILSTMDTFAGALIFFSLLYGAGIGITMSANGLALNTYFKKKRRIATGFSWTCTGMGPIIIPQVITLLMPKYGIEGTVLIIGGVTFNSVACALLLQPVSRHIKKKRNTDQLNRNEDVDCKESSTKNNSKKERITSFRLMFCEKFGSQYLYYDDEEDGASGIDVIGPSAVMMSRANDGWFSRKDTSTVSIASKTSNKESTSKCSSQRPPLTISRQSSLNRGSPVRNINRQHGETDSHRRKVAGLQSAGVPRIVVNESSENPKNGNDPNCNKKDEQNTLIPEEEVETDQLINQGHVEEKPKSFFNKVIIFFDLDLLRDPIYVNLMLGVTLASFTELNFSILTPFILGEYGYTKVQVATYMSILAGVDVGTRLTIPFVADFIGWENRTFFLVGICGMAAGRIVLAHVWDYSVALAISVLIGVGKGFRTIFMALVIPSHVPLSRLPGATGIQLLTSGIVALVFGPIIGWLRDVTSDYAVMLHCLNILTFYTTISWCLEVFITKRKSKMAAQKKEAQNKPLTV
ncbi:PREDICTED: uncharacterized protein LOC107186349 [Dufourea novaeangliae]|uniref:uncharacterized protein LOC107186349 n=1 Tax=Dufourea novaeangliae TaxID=178035 RepID=UPI0007675B9D|nr:PREDICTED: uncharacterized protein LOC107186349 [Dufourea novaeangliae]